MDLTSERKLVSSWRELRRRLEGQLVAILNNQRVSKVLSVRNGLDGVDNGTAKISDTVRDIKTSDPWELSTFEENPISEVHSFSSKLGS